ncbi:phosphoserine phosphatase SerB [Allochromatium humboldtianum]|jgi:phosphoserine phosphatase|uniref:Phosphoserine phosphatase n=1 Tax=Allochromatium humboldtianum TaxID=504901 RepID=A0A850R5C3_9GAMM|nr:phosphoserine phosphatase SerB [Allochromatium humboldtianum]NVZ09879.1 phosphoserine phosphatase SerB [Allochromatium humboldtianum]
MSEIVLINVTGEDRPGITAALTAILARYDVPILDIGQSTIHNALALGLMVELPRTGSDCGVFKELLFSAHTLGLDIRFTPIAADDYEGWVHEQGQPRHILTLVGREIEAEHIARVSAVVAERGLNVDRIARLTGRISRRERLPAALASVELSVRGAVPDLTELHGALLALGRVLDVDISVQEDDIFRRNRRLVCFDMDSTLIQTEVIDELAAAAGVGAEVAAITEAAMRGELDFKESFRRRMALLKGLDESVLAGIAERLPITEGADRLIATLKRLGYKVAILSGGFTYFAEHLQRRFGIDYVHANRLEFRDGKLTGEVSGEIVDGARKAELLREIAAREGIRLEQVIAVGDGANDLPMLAIAGLGIAFHAKPIVTEQARHAIATVGLDAILYLLGMRDRDVEALA